MKANLTSGKIIFKSPRRSETSNSPWVNPGFDSGISGLRDAHKVVGGFSFCPVYLLGEELFDA
jgi:hypothetical protein